MATVDTVAGAVDVAALGTTYMHEHVFILSPEVQAHWPGYMGWDEEREIEVAREQLVRLKRERGCDTIVDPTVAGLGRHVAAVAEAARGTGVNVVVATGYYVYDRLPMAFQLKSHEARVERLYELFMGDVEEGIEGTGVKPGVLKCAVHVDGVTPDVEAVLRACARVHRETGIPITTHTHPETRRGLDQLRILGEEEGVDMASLVIGHCNESAELDYLEELLASGAYIGFDRCGKTTPTVSLDGQLDNLAELLRRGYASQIVLSHDHMSFIDWLEPEEMAAKASWHPYGYLEEGLLPGLRDRGVEAADLEQMLVANPRDYFARRSALVA